MKISFIGQPILGGGQLGPRLIHALDELEGGTAWFAVAWAKHSGLSRIATALTRFQEGGEAEAIIGVDEGGATVEGLRLAIELFDPVFVLHDRGKPTYHPKFYVVQTENRARVLLGSGNATKGGLFTNYETALELDLSLTDEHDRTLLKQIRVYYDDLRSCGDTTKPLTNESIEALLRDPAVQILSEKQAGARRRRRRQLTEERENETGVSFFGAARKALAGAPAAPALAPGDADDEDDLGPPVDAEVEAAVAEAVAGMSEAPIETPAPGEGRSFYKALSGFDVSGSSAPGQIIIPIGFRDFFPQLTIEKDETATGGVRQSATEFNMTFEDDAWTKSVEARVILYEPASNHPRPNSELRFTFRDVEIRERLAKDDVLVFRRDGDAISVERRPPGSLGPPRFDEIDA